MQKTLIKPNLLDSHLEKKIIKTLKSNEEHYWEPTKNTLKSFYQKVIKPHYILVTLILVIIIFLFYRYRNTKKQKKNGKKKKDDNSQYFYEDYYDQLREPKIPKAKMVTGLNNGNQQAYPIYPYGGGTLVANNAMH
jgi:hypothetical protein